MIPTDHSQLPTESIKANGRRTGPRFGISYLAASAILLVGVLLLVLNARQYWPYLADDTLISLRYVERLLDGYGLTWTEGIPVEGYSNLLWILLISSLGLFGVDLLLAVRILGFLGMIGVIGAILYRYRVHTWADLWPPLVGVAFFTLSIPTGVWMLAGLEQPLVAALLAWGMVMLLRGVESDQTSTRHLWVASLCLGLLCITRSDGPLFTAAAVLGVFVAKGLGREELRTAGRLVILPMIFTLGQQIFRLAYYGEWLPNPALVKISPSWVHFVSGWDYVWTGLQSLVPLSFIPLLAGVAILFFRKQISPVFQVSTKLLVIPILTWLIYVVFIGGDIFPGHRHIVVVVVLLVLVIGESVRLVSRHATGRLAQVGVIIVVSLGLMWFHQNELKDPRNLKENEKTMVYGGQVIGTMLKRGFGEVRPLVAVTAAGCIPYWSGLPCIDMLGLNDYYLARNHPEGFGQGWIGHELRNDQYIIDRGADMIIIHLGGDWMYKMRQFYDSYILCHFVGYDPYRLRTALWIKRSSDKIGIRTDDSTVTIPAYLLNGNQKTTAHLTDDNRFVVPVSIQQPAWLPWIEIPAGRWRIEVVASADVSVSIKPIGESETPPVMLDSVFIDAPIGGKIRLNVSRNSADAAEVERIILRRDLQ